MHMIKTLNHILRYHKYKLAILMLITAASVVCVILVLARIAYSNSYGYVGLIWNLFPCLDSICAGLFCIHFVVAAVVHLYCHPHLCIPLADLFPKRTIYSYRPPASWTSISRSFIVEFSECPDMVRCDFVGLVFVDRNVAWNYFPQSHAGNHPTRIWKMVWLDICPDCSRS